MAKRKAAVPHVEQPVLGTWWNRLRAFPTTHRAAFALLLLVQVAFFGPMLLRGEVIFAHDNSTELGLPAVKSQRISNRKFSDQSSFNVPEIQHHLHGARSGWIATWNPHVELGRPDYHIGAMSPAFLITRLYSFATDDAFTLYTWLAVTTVLLTGVFAYLWLQSLELHAAACLTGALGLSLGVFASYWLTFMLFIWGICWTLALLWLVNRFVQRSTFLTGAAIAFSIHALLLTGYQQQIVWNAYLVTGFTLASILRHPGTSMNRVAVALGLLLAVLTGVVSVAPVYLDLALTLARSPRGEPDPQLFLSWVFAARSWNELPLFASSLVDAFWFGNPIEHAYPHPFHGQCLTPLLCLLLLLSFTDAQWRRLWFWQAFLGVCVIMGLWPAFYLFGVWYLGLRLSPWDPFISALVPAVTLAAYAADHLIRVGLSQRRLALVLALLPGLALAGGVVSDPGRLAPGFVASGVGFLLAAVCFAWKPSPALLAAVAVAGAFHYGHRLMLVRPPEEIRLTSPLVETIRRETRDGSRYAWLFLWGIPPGQETLLGLRTVHTYDTASPRAYHDWVRRISRQGPTGYRGGYFHAIVPRGRLDVRELALAGVSLVLSPMPLDPELGESVGRHGRMGIYRLRQRPLLEARFETYRLSADANVSIEGPLDRTARLDVERTADLGDEIRFQLPSGSSDALLFVSQQYHPQWEAFSGERRLATHLVNGFYTGVIVPPGTTHVELRFHPWVRWSWIPHMFFLVLGAVSIGVWLRAKRPSTG